MLQPAPAVLTMSDIRKSYPGVVALDGVSLELRIGEVHVLLGENGAGKSTLMKILGGSVRMDGGTITLDGKPVDIRSPRDAQELGIGTVHQELHLVPQLSAGENIFLGREPGRVGGIIDRAAILRDAQRVLDDLSSGISAWTPVQRLSVAQQQMVEIARALSLNARILIMDEPTSALTGHEIARLFAAIAGLKERNVSVIYISHRMDEIFQIGDRVTVLLDGRSLGTRAIAEVTRSELIRLMVNREVKEHFPRVRPARGKELLRVEQLSRKGVLRGISFSLYTGEILGIAGLVGSGRTELARVLFGLERFHAGTITIEEKPFSAAHPRAAIARGMGFLTEDRKREGLILRLSVRENILLAALRRVSPFGIIRTRIETLMAGRAVEDLRIKTPGLDQAVVHLSGGNQQKVVLGKWLSSGARILIFDEPTRGIDVGAKIEIYSLMNRLTAEGAAIIMISSELPEILGMSDRILVMRQGSVAAELDAGSATQEIVLRHALGN